MSTFQIIKAPSPILSSYCTEVTKINNENEIKKRKELADKMLRTMQKSGGIGLAAPQVGILERMFVIHIQGDDKNEIPGYNSTCDPLCIINPRIIELSKEKINLPEGCLSVQEVGNQIMIIRPKYLTMEYFDCNGKEQSLKADGWLARCIQHELDHLNGILFIQHLLRYL
ncbi:peptide deformylase [Wolbachia endosymbiont of Pentidionis agamae]|uniref:peptide deformylase n=1 Tax=Wolbachia endosymbiont of Pentidionis agamae TaxID=3110435 RepID=UPI002FCE6B35